MAALSNCVFSQGAEEETSGRSVPSELSFQTAMEAAFQSKHPGTTVAGSGCRAVRNLQCALIETGSRVRCTYVYARGRVGTAVLEPERHGFWRWIDGPKGCSTSRSM